MAVEQGLEQAIRDFSGSKRICIRLGAEGFTTVFSLMHATPEQLEGIVGRSGLANVDRSLSSFFEELKITPSLRLMRSVIAEEVNPLPASREADLDQAVNDALNSLSERERGVIKRRFGFVGWRIRTLDEVADVYKVTKARVCQIEAKVLRKLSFPFGLHRMQRFLALPANSFAYKIAGLDIVRADLETLEDILLQELGLEEIFPVWPNVARLAEADADDVSAAFSASQLEQLGVSLRDVYEKAKNGKYQKKAEPTSEDEKDQMPVYENRLLPDLDIPPEVIKLIGDKPLWEIKIPIRVYHAIKRRGIVTIGDVLAKTADELLKMRQFGNKGLNDLTYALGIYIRELMTQGLEPFSKERYLLEGINSLPEVSAGRFQPIARDRFSVKEYGAYLTFVRRILYLPDGESISFVTVAVAGELSAKNQAIQYLTKLLGIPTDRTRPKPEDSNNPDYLTFINPNLKST